MVPARARGFTYLGLMILVSILALIAAAGLKMGSVLERAAAEEELLEIGAQFSEALRSYAAATPPGKPPQPPGLQDLLKDPRFPNPRRHLRKIFVDPMTGKAEWGIIYLGDKVGVLGVHSLSGARPLKIANFDIRFLNMENREKISDWKFLVAGGEGGLGSDAVPANSMTGVKEPVSLFPSAVTGGKTAGASQDPGSIKGANQPPAAMPPAAPPPAARPLEPPVGGEEPPAEPPPEDETEEPPEEPKPVDPVEPVEQSEAATPPPTPRRR
jgi:type II secretory pathway pseudopilin PulG